MVKHTQTNRRQELTNCLGVFDHFVGLALKGLKSDSNVAKDLAKLNFYESFLFTNICLVGVSKSK